MRCRFKYVRQDSGKYQAHVITHGQAQNLGSYVDEQEAARPVDAARIFVVQTLYSSAQAIAASHAIGLPKVAAYHNVCGHMVVTHFTSCMIEMAIC